jgi:tetratricopeptide (TPR) repeat protein
MGKLRKGGPLILLFIAGLILGGCAPKTGGRDRAERAYLAAAEAYAEERFGEALEYLGESLRIDPDFYQARFLEGKILFFQNRLEKAAELFAGLCAKHPEYTEARLWNLRCLVLSGKDPRIVQEALDRELSFNPSDWRVLYLYALLAGNNGDWEKRLSMGRRAENALSDSAKVYLDMALSWHSLGLKDRAVLALEKARILSGGNMSLARLGDAAAELIDGPGETGHGGPAARFTGQSAAQFTDQAEQTEQLTKQLTEQFTDQTERFTEQFFTEQFTKQTDQFTKKFTETKGDNDEQAD